MFTPGALEHFPSPLRAYVDLPLILLGTIDISYQDATYNSNARAQLEAAQDLWSFALVRI